MNCEPSSGSTAPAKFLVRGPAIRQHGARAATQLLLQAGRPGYEHLHCSIDEAMMTQTTSGTGASLVAKRATVDWDVGYHGHRFCYSKRDAKAYPHQLARLRMRVHQARYEQSLSSGNAEDGQRCFQDRR